MANTPKKVKDPTEVALSAIQEALNISDTAADTSRNASMRNETAPSVAPPAPPVFDDEPTFEPSPAWRGQQMSSVAQAMAQVAIRFSEPEGSASDSMVTVGQAIRREVAAMGDGIERAIARAGELETLVANEVAALERAYSDNEVRIRALLQDIAHT